MNNLFNSIKNLKEKILNFFSEFRSIPIEKKSAYFMTCSLFMCSFILVIWFIIENAGLILAILTLFGLYLLGRQPVTKPKVISFYQDIQPVRQCCFDSLRSLSDLFDWIPPISMMSIDVNFRASSDNIERYYFRVRKRSTNPCSLPSFEQRTIFSEDLNHNFLLNQPYFVSEINGLYLDFCNDKGTYVEMAVIPVKPSTYEYIQRQEKKYNAEYERSLVTRKAPNDAASLSLPHPFCRKDLWNKYGKLIFITQDMDIYPHILCFGPTGSGKTTAIKSITYHILVHYDGCELFLGDYKGLDYNFLSECKNYFPHNNYANALQLFNDKLEARINGTDTSKNRCLLVLDEWNNYLSTLSTKELNDATKKLSSVLNMGRAHKMNVLIGSQSGHVELFGKSRDSISTVLGLGQLSKESIGMFYREYHDIITPQPRGNGYLLQDGEPLREVIILRAKNMDKLEKVLIERANI